MAMAVVEARYPELALRVKTVRTALLLGEARRRVARGDHAGALRFFAAALREGGVVGPLGVAGHMARSAYRRRFR